jgi:hypothetical protein
MTAALEAMKDNHTGPERRTALRTLLPKSMRRRAWIDVRDGSARRECWMYDYSYKGARVILGLVCDIPDTFRLMLGGDGAYRDCRVVWRADDHVGIEYLAAHAA